MISNILRNSGAHWAYFPICPPHLLSILKNMPIWHTWHIEKCAPVVWQKTFDQFCFLMIYNVTFRNWKLHTEYRFKPSINNASTPGPTWAYWLFFFCVSINIQRFDSIPFFSKPKLTKITVSQELPRFHSHTYRVGNLKV